jgi:hypothetical protein
MNKIGYIVQFYDEDSVSPHGTGKELFRRFEDALEYANKLAKKWLQMEYSPMEGAYEFITPDQKNVDNRISGLVFRCAQILIWIEIIYEKLG